MPQLAITIRESAEGDIGCLFAEAERIDNHGIEPAYLHQTDLFPRPAQLQVQVQDTLIRLSIGPQRHRR